MNGADTIRFPVIRSHFGEKLAVADASRGGESGCFLDTGFAFFGNIYSQFYSFFIMSNVKNCFVNGEGLDEVCVLLEHLVYLLRNF